MELRLWSMVLCIFNRTHICLHFRAELERQGVPTKQTRMKKGKNFLLLVLVCGVYLLHQDYWNWKKASPLVFGFLPIGLAYQAGYSILAAVMMAVLVKFAWP